jgi:hypothetical protein
MASKADFNADEWSTVVEGPLMAGLRVVTAERGGTLRESMAIGRVYKDAREAHGQNELLDALVASPPGFDAQKLQSEGDLPTVTSQRLRDAHKEGGFVGIGAKRVNEAEQAALDEIASIVAGPPDP